MKLKHPTLKDWQTWAIIGLMVVVAIVSNSYRETVQDVQKLQKEQAAEARVNCNRDNYRISIGTSAYLQLSKAAANTEDVWRHVETILAMRGEPADSALRGLAQQQIGINHVAAVALRQLAVAIANAEGPNSAAPYSDNLPLRAQAKCN